MPKLTAAQFFDMPPLWLGLFALLAWLSNQIWPVLDLGRPGDLAGGLLVLAGLLLMAAAFREFGRHRTSVVPHQEPAALITSGVYRLSRNPIYLADAAILAGLCLIWNALPALLLVPVFMAVITRRFIRPEEERLVRAFGPAFAAWSQRTGRWL